MEQEGAVGTRRKVIYEVNKPEAAWLASHRPKIVFFLEISLCGRSCSLLYWYTGCPKIIIYQELFMTSMVAFSRLVPGFGWILSKTVAS